MSEQTQYGLPSVAIAVLEIAQREVGEAKREHEMSLAALKKAEARYSAFCTALAATVGVPEGTPVTVDLVGQQLVVSPVVSPATLKGS